MILSRRFRRLECYSSELLKIVELIAMDGLRRVGARQEHQICRNTVSAFSFGTCNAGGLVAGSFDLSQGMGVEKPKSLACECCRGSGERRGSSGQRTGGATKRNGTEETKEQERKWRRPRAFGASTGSKTPAHEKATRASGARAGREPCATWFSCPFWGQKALCNSRRPIVLYCTAMYRV
jgi:hypothetical protein